MVSQRGSNWPCGSCSSSHIFLITNIELVFDAWYPQRNYGIGYNYACSDIIGSDINILATCEESLFLFTVCHLAAVHPFLAERGKSTIKARGEMGVRSEALNNPKNHLNMCDGARVSGITGERQQVLPGLCYSFSALSLEWNSVRLAQNFLSHSTSVDVKAPSSEVPTLPTFCPGLSLDLKSYISTCLLNGSLFLSCCLIKLNSERFLLNSSN